MGKIVGFFLGHKMMVNLIISVIVIFGLQSVLNSKKEGFPEISMNQVIIQTIFPGASPRDVEINVTVPIEETLEEVEGIKEILSTSEESISRIIVKADENAKPAEFQKMYSDIENAIAGVSNLPNDLEGPPALNEFTSSDVPVMEIAFSGPYEILKPYLDQLERKIRRLNGVAGVDVIGLPDAEVQILVDPVLANKHRVDLRLIADAIRKRNLEGSGGTLESFISEKKVVFLSKFENYESVLDTNVFMGPDGFGVKLRQVATIQIVPEDLRLLVRNNGKPGASMSIRKTGQSDLLKSVDNVHQLLESETLPKHVKMDILFDQSSLTRDRINLLVGNALIGFLLVIGILFYVFDAKTAIWTAFGIPFTLLGLIIVLYINDISLNLISLGGFVIIIGMLVDDAIVISEEINSNKERGLNPRKAAITAVQHMWMPVLASSATTMVAFSPLFALGGFPGKFIWAIPLMVIIGLLISLFESFFILPSHLFHGQKQETKKKKFVVTLENLYEKMLKIAIQYRYITLGFFIVTLFISLFALKTFVKKDPFPQDAAEGFNISLTLPLGANSATTINQIKKVEQLLTRLPKNEIIGYSSRIGTQSAKSATIRGTQNNLAIIFVYLTPYEQRDQTAMQIMAALDNNIPAILDSKETQFNLNLNRIGPPLGRDFEMRLISNDDSIRAKKEAEVIAWLNTFDGLSDIKSDAIDGKEELNLKINYDILAQAGLSVADILTTLRIAFDGLVVTDMTTVERTTDFRLRLNEKARADINFINNLPVVNRLGNLIHLSRFVSISEQEATAQISHVNGQRAVSIFANVDIKKIDSAILLEQAKKKFPTDNTITVEYSGQPVENELIFSGLSSAALIALIGIYLLIALILNSYKKPLLIMLPLPFLVIGLAFALLSHGIPLSMMPGIAMIGLMGVVINDSIVMVHTIYKLPKEKSIKSHHIITGAVSRLRPVILTTITTVFGVLPTGYGIGGYDPFLSHMSIVMAYGLLFSTLIILYMIPIFFHIGLDIEKHISPKINKIKDQIVSKIKMISNSGILNSKI